MNPKGKKILVHDMTLRDGMHPKRHQMTLEQMRSIAIGLDEAGVPLIEVTHGDGLGGSSVNYGFPAHTDEEYLSTVVPLMKRAGSGRIVNIGSPVGLSGLAQFAGYGTAKAGVIGLTLSLAHELAGAGITVNCVQPSAATTRNNRDRAEREAKTGLSVAQTPADKILSEDKRGGGAAA